MSDKKLIEEANKQGIQIDKETKTSAYIPTFVPDYPQPSKNTGNVEMPDGTVVRNVPLDIGKKLRDGYALWKRHYLWEIVYKTSINASLFPIITFIIWLVIGWIGAGFRSKKST